MLNAVLNKENQQQNPFQGSVQQPGSVMVIPSFETFDQNKEQFIQYIQRFKNYTTLKGIQEDVILLLNTSS